MTSKINSNYLLIICVNHTLWIIMGNESLEEGVLLLIAPGCKNVIPKPIHNDKQTLVGFYVFLIYC